MAQSIKNVPTQNFLQKALDVELAAGATASATLNNTTGIQNLPGVMIVDRVDTSGGETASKRETIGYTATSGSTVTTLSRGLAGSTDQVHAVGAIVEFAADVIWAQSIYDAITQVITPSTGLLDTTKVAAASGATLSNPTFNLGSGATGSLYFESGAGVFSRIPLGAAGRVLTANASQPYWEVASSGGGGGTAFWTALPTTPAWVSNTVLSIDDVSNAGVYDKLFGKRTVFKWDDGTYRTAISAGASYSSNKVYVALLGASLATFASLSTFRYAIPQAEVETFIVPGSLPIAGSTTINVSKQYVTTNSSYIVGADAVVAVGGSGATLTVFDIKADNASLFSATATLKNYLPTLATMSLNVPTLSPMTVVNRGARVTIDIISSNQTAPTDAYLYVYSIPEGWRYRT